MKSLTAVLALPLLVLTGCPRDKEEDLSLGEATQAVHEASLAGQAEGLTSASVDLSTNFTIGKAVAEGADELRAFIASQLPCAEVTLEDATVSVDYGVNPGMCSYHGHSFSGTHAITLERNEDAAVEVHHAWTEFTNGIVTLNGTANVTWNFSDKTRRVEHESTWKSNASGRTGKGSGDRVQSLLAGGLAEGIRVNGVRAWEGERGRWDLAIDSVELRWTDPVPQAGSYTLATPFGKTVSMAFDRVDDDTIRVTVAGPKRDFSFTVSKLGDVSED